MTKEYVSTTGRAAYRWGWPPREPPSTRVFWEGAGAWEPGRLAHGADRIRGYADGHITPDQRFVAHATYLDGSKTYKLTVPLPVPVLVGDRIRRGHRFRNPD